MRCFECGSGSSLAGAPPVEVPWVSPPYSGSCKCWKTQKPGEYELSPLKSKTANEAKIYAVGQLEKTR